MSDDSSHVDVRLLLLLRLCLVIDFRRTIGEGISEFSEAVGGGSFEKRVVSRGTRVSRLVVVEAEHFEI